MNDIMTRAFVDELEKCGKYSEMAGRSIGREIGSSIRMHKKGLGVAARTVRSAGRTAKAGIRGLARTTHRGLRRVGSAPGRALRAGISGVKEGYNAGMRPDPAKVKRKNWNQMMKEVGNKGYAKVHGVRPSGMAPFDGSARGPR